jgi:hypothetical protein
MFASGKMKVANPESVWNCFHLKLELVFGMLRSLEGWKFKQTKLKKSSFECVDIV